MSSLDDGAAQPQQHDRDIVLIHLNRGASNYDPESRRNSLTESFRLKDVRLQRQKLEQETPVLSRAEIENEFHSARKPEHRLSVNGTENIRNPAGLSTKEAQVLLSKYGPNELVENKKSRLKLFVEQFTGPMPIGIWIGIVVEFSLQNWLDAAILLTLQFLNGFVGFYESNKADNAIAALKASLKPHAQVKRDGGWKVIDARECVPGDCIMLAAGTAVPADCVINDHSVSIDQSSITGESVPVRKVAGDQAFMGSTVARGEAEATVFATGMSTIYGKTAALLKLNESSGLGDLDKIILRIVANLLILSVALCTITLVYLLTQGQNFRRAISFTVVLLIASIPVAIEVVVTATLALGSRELSSHHAIVAHLSAIERLAGMSILCSDKTGTLTLNQMKIQDECPVFYPHWNRDHLILHAALATKWNEPAKDALDTMVLNIADLKECGKYVQLSYTPFDPDLKRTEARLMGPDGQTFTTMKGAPHVLLALCADRDRIHEAVEVAVRDLASRGVRSLAIAKTNEDGNLYMMGLITFLDPPRPDAKSTIQMANSYGVKVKMITGDHQLVARETAKALALGSSQIVSCASNVLPVIDLQSCNGKLPDTLGRQYGDLILKADGFSQALPEHKYLIIEALKQRGLIVGMTGDGVNDAPALKVSHVGVAVQGATDAARAAADIVLTSPGLNAIVEAIVISRRIFSRMNAFLIYRVAATIQLLIFFFISVLFIKPQSYNMDFPQFWTMPVFALITITVLNDGTIVSIAYDHVEPAKSPRHWNVKQLWLLSTVLGLVACASSLLILVTALKSTTPNSLFNAVGLPSLSFGQVVAVMYLKVSLSDFLTLFSARTGKKLFFSFRPSLVLVGAAIFALAASTIVALTWPFKVEGGSDSGQALDIYICVFVWIYCLVWFVIQDVSKNLLFKVMDWYTHTKIHTPAVVSEELELV